MSKNIIEIALNAGFLNTSNGLESPFIEGEDLTDNLKLFASLLLAQPEQDNIQYLLDQVARLTAENAMLKEKWLAPPEQEPVAWMQDSVELYVQESKDTIRGYVIPLYTAPPNREPLSDEAVCEILLKKEWRGFVDLVRIIEKAHGIGGGE